MHAICKFGWTLSFPFARVLGRASWHHTCALFWNAGATRFLKSSVGELRLSTSASSESVHSTSTHPRLSSNCSIVRGPMITEVKIGLARHHARENWLQGVPRPSQCSLIAWLTWILTSRSSAWTIRGSSSDARVPSGYSPKVVYLPVRMPRAKPL